MRTQSCSYIPLYNRGYTLLYTSFHTRLYIRCTHVCIHVLHTLYTRLYTRSTHVCIHVLHTLYTHLLYELRSFATVCYGNLVTYDQLIILPSLAGFGDIRQFDHTPVAKFGLHNGSYILVLHSNADSLAGRQQDNTGRCACVRENLVGSVPNQKKRITTCALTNIRL